MSEIPSEPTYLVSLEELKSWTSETKTRLTKIDADMMTMISSEILGRLSSRYVTRAWVSSATTPAIVRKIICMRYVGWFYLRSFAEVEQPNSYGERLLAEANNLLEDIIEGSIILIDVEAIEDVNTSGLSFEPAESEPSFYMDSVW